MKKMQTAVTIGLVVSVLMLVPQAVSAQKTINDRNWHISLLMSGYGMSSDYGTIYNGLTKAGAAYNISGGGRIMVSLSKRVSDLISIGARASIGGEGEANVNGASAGTCSEYQAIGELRQPLGKWFAFKGTLGAGIASYKKVMGLTYYVFDGDIGDVASILDSYGSVNEKSFELLIEPTLELRLSSVVSFDIIGSYRYLPGKSIELGSSKIDILQSRFTMGGGISFHIS